MIGQTTTFAGFPALVFAVDEHFATVAVVTPTRVELGNIALENVCATAGTGSSASAALVAAVMLVDAQRLRDEDEVADVLECQAGIRAAGLAA